MVGLRPGARTGKSRSTGTRTTWHRYGTCTLPGYCATLNWFATPSSTHVTPQDLQPGLIRLPGVTSQGGSRDRDEGDLVRAEGPDAPLLRLEVRALWKAWSRESFAFWALCLYFFIEYVRPQSVWQAIAVVPFGKVSLAIALFALVFDGLRARRLHLLDGLLLGFTAILVASSLSAYRPSWAFEDWPLFLNWLIVYFLVTSVVTTPRRMLLFWGLFMLWSLKMSQHGTRSFIMRGFSFASWGATGAPGWFQNSGEFAIQMCVFLPMALHVILGLRATLPRWKLIGLLGLLPATALISLLASSSRGGQVGMVAVLLFMVAQSKQRVRGLLASAVVLIGLWFILPPEQKERFETMGEDQTSQSRLTYWEDGIEIMNRYPMLGIGFNNWIPYYHRHYNAAGELPHNVFVEAGSEMGYSGLLAFVALILGTAVINHRTRRLSRQIPDWGPMLRNMAYGLDGALVGFLVSGFFVTVLYYPFFWVNLAFTAALFETARSTVRRMASIRTSPNPRAGTDRGEAALGYASGRPGDDRGWVRG